LIDKIWVTGAGGLLGNYLVRSAPEFLPNTVVIGLTRSRFDLLDYASFGLTSAMHNAAGHKTSRQRMDCARLAAAFAAADIAGFCSTAIIF